jgi:uncharacterized protein YqgV (UPF0045/DUF77 family)
MSVIVELSLFPMDKGTASLAPYVARVLKVLENSACPSSSTPWEPAWRGVAEVLAVVCRCMEEHQQDSEPGPILLIKATGAAVARAA